MRQYQPIWIALKSKGNLKVAIPKQLHRRVIKAVMKERYMDDGFKLELLENEQRCWIQYAAKGEVVEFTLKYSLGLKDIL
jgi:hypothetical protein